MSQLERQIQKAQHRLWLQRALHQSCLWLTVAGALFAVTILLHRLFALRVDLVLIGPALLFIAVVGALLCTWLRRESATVAALVLDEAARLRERLSSAHYCRDDADPFAVAVYADAERVSATVSPRQHIRLAVPSTAACAAASFAFAALMFLVPAGLLVGEESQRREARNEQMQQTKAAVARQMDHVRRLLETTPGLTDLKTEVEPFDRMLAKPADPAAIRHDAVKKIDHLADAVRQRRESTQYDAVKEMRRMLRGLHGPQSPDAPTQKLNRALARGDFKSAREEIKALREQLATLQSEQDKELREKISKQLDDLARQLEKLATENRLAEKLKKEGLSEQDLKKVLERLEKKDLEQIRQELEKKGVPPQQAQKLAERLRRQQQAGNLAKKLAQAMRQATGAGDTGQVGGAMNGLSMAADQLSELEAMELEMLQLDTMLADLQNARESIDRPGCSGCGGTGCKLCGGGQGPGMGPLGQGRGGLAPEDPTDVGFKIERGKVPTGRGAITGQFLVDGQQVKGDVAREFVDVVVAAERDASDRINRNRIPRQYHQAVKAYFSHVQNAAGAAARQPADTAPPENSANDEE